MRSRGKHRHALTSGKMKQRTYSKQARSTVVAGVFQVLPIWRPTQRRADAGRQTHGPVQGLGYHGQIVSCSKSGNFFLQAQAKGGRRQSPGTSFPKSKCTVHCRKTANKHLHFVCCSSLVPYSNITTVSPTYAWHVYLDSLCAGFDFLLKPFFQLAFLSISIKTPCIPSARYS